MSYIFVALLLVSLLSFATNFLLEKQFENYIIEQQEKRNKQTVNLVIQLYNGEKGIWDIEGIQKVGISALEQGVILKVKDKSSNTIWDATVHNNGACVSMLEHMAQNMDSRYRNFKGEYVETSYPVKNNFSDVGSIELGYYGPFYFTDNDLVFINTLNKMLIIVGGLSLVFALILGEIMSRRLSRPILSVIAAAKQITSGNLKYRVLNNSSTKEIGQLTTTINELAEDLEKQENLRKRMTSDVAHELRTPLATLQGYLEAMIDGIWKMDVERLKSCHEEILRINRMVGDLEKLAKYESENLRLVKTNFNISELIQHVLNNFEADFAKKDIRINFSEMPMHIFADKDKISQVMVNIISNALKYTTANGFITIDIKALNNNIRISVKDSGIGISSEDLPHIFERFYRADKSRNRMSGGSGIGLAIVKAIIEAHNGKISVFSELGKGTEFILSLPRQIN